jgi:hypothetical protein
VRLYIETELAITLLSLVPTLLTLLSVPVRGMWQCASATAYPVALTWSLIVCGYIFLRNLELLLRASSHR